MLCRPICRSSVGLSAAGSGIYVRVEGNQAPAAWVVPPPGTRQSLSPFESRATTMAVLWSVMLVSVMVLLVCLIVWV